MVIFFKKITFLTIISVNIRVISFTSSTIF